MIHEIVVISSFRLECTVQKKIQSVMVIIMEVAYLDDCLFNKLCGSKPFHSMFKQKMHKQDDLHYVGTKLRGRSLWLE